MARKERGYRKVSAAVRVALSLVIVFQLFVVFLMPNSETWLGQRTLPWLAPYVNSLELAATWSFFAPDPGPPPVFVEWEIEDGNGDQVSTGYFPERWEPYVLRERQNRRIAATRFIALTDERTEQVMLNYICRKNPQAYGVTLWRTVYTTPSLNDVASGERKIGDEVGMQRKWISHSFCELGAES